MDKESEKYLRAAKAALAMAHQKSDDIDAKESWLSHAAEWTLMAHKGNEGGSDGGAPHP